MYSSKPVGHSQCWIPGWLPCPVGHSQHPMPQNEDMRFQLFESSQGLTVFVASSRHAGGAGGTSLRLGSMVERVVSCVSADIQDTSKHRNTLATDVRDEHFLWCHVADLRHQVILKTYPAINHLMCACVCFNVVCSCF